MPKQTYSGVIKVKQLLSLMVTQTDEIDESLFVTVHQACELYFAQILKEIDLLCDCFDQHNEEKILVSCRRIITLVRQLETQTDVLKGISIDKYYEFIPLYQNASGIQSYQFRLIEFRLRFKDKHKLSYTVDPEELSHLTAGLEREDLHEKYEKYLLKNYQILTETTKSGNLDYEDLVSFVLLVYKNPKEFSKALLLFETLIDLDESFINWRYRHLSLARRIVGDTSPGTGGTIDRSYLSDSLNKRIFPEFWEARSRLRIEHFQPNPSAVEPKVSEEIQ